MADEKTQLTGPARDAIRSYMLSLFLIGGSFAAVIAFMLGFIIRDVALAKAEAVAVQGVQSKVIETAARLATVAADLDRMQKDVDSVRSRYEDLRFLKESDVAVVAKQIKDAPELVALLKKAETAKIVIGEWKQPPGYKIRQSERIRFEFPQGHFAKPPQVFVSLRDFIGFPGSPTGHLRMRAIPEKVTERGFDLKISGDENDGGTVNNDVVWFALPDEICVLARQVK